MTHGGTEITTKNQDKEYEQNTAMALSDGLERVLITIRLCIFWYGIYFPSEPGNNDNNNPNLLH